MNDQSLGSIRQTPHGPPSRRGGHRGDRHHRLLIVVAAALAATVALGVAVLALKPRNTAPSPSPESFAAQMNQAANGEAVTTSVYGGAIRVERKGNQVTVSADNVPSGVCVSVGWKLVRKGILSINGTTPLRVSAAKLAELCNQEDGNAALSWTPRTGD